MQILCVSIPYLFQIKERKAFAKMTILKTLRTRATVFASIFGGGGIIIYNDMERLHRMEKTYKSGSLSCPFRDHTQETSYFRRPKLENKMRAMLEPRNTNEYYIVRGEVGSGKSRTLVELVREFMTDNKSGAPVYVLASQGRTFAESLAAAVNFKFDEHVNFQFFLSFMFGIQRLPGKEEGHKLVRVLDAIEKSASKYATQHGKPVVLIIDGTNILTEHYPGTLEKLQEKAKLWADLNICKIIFVSNEEKTENLLMRNSSCWSRVATPQYIDDLTEEEAIKFLRHAHMDRDVDGFFDLISDETAEKIYKLVGGRIYQLMQFKRDASHGIPFEETRDKLLLKDREKFLGFCKIAPICTFVVKLWNEQSHSCLLYKVLQTVSKDIVDECIDRGIVKLRRGPNGVIVQFESKLTEVTVQKVIQENSAK